MATSPRTSGGAIVPIGVNRNQINKKNKTHGPIKLLGKYDQMLRDVSVDMGIGIERFWPRIAILRKGTIPEYLIDYGHSVQ